VVSVLEHVRAETLGPATPVAAISTVKRLAHNIIIHTPKITTWDPVNACNRKPVVDVDQIRLTLLLKGLLEGLPSTGTSSQCHPNLGVTFSKHSCVLIEASEISPWHWHCDNHAHFAWREVIERPHCIHDALVDSLFLTMAQELPNLDVVHFEAKQWLVFADFFATLIRGSASPHRAHQ
jgi:hypothetical protein